jgi:hypothetical protein
LNNGGNLRQRYGFQGKKKGLKLFWGAFFLFVFLKLFVLNKDNFFAKKGLILWDGFKKMFYLCIGILRSRFVNQNLIFVMKVLKRVRAHRVINKKTFVTHWYSFSYKK